jgi:ParB family chromosome partitioning protein
LESLIPLPTENDSGGIRMVPVDEIKPSSEQARRQFDEDPLRELAESIRAHGLLQPVLVRRVPNGYELVAGERRWRASRMAGLDRIPAVVREGTDDSHALLLGLIENLQREDLDPIEEARGVQRLIEHFQLTHEEAAARLGKHRVAISQALRLLNGCPAVQSAIASGAISSGHGRALVGLNSTEAQELGLKVIIARRLSVRQTEAWVKSYQAPKPRRESKKPAADPDLDALAEELSERLGLPVELSGSGSKGRITIAFDSPSDLEIILNRLS